MSSPIPVDLGRLVTALPALPPDDFAGLLGLVGALLPPGVVPTLFLADYQETVLSALGPNGWPGAERHPVEGSLPGRSFLRQEPVPAGEGHVLWLPVTNRWRRLGVLRLQGADLDLASLAAAAKPIGSFLATVVDSASRCTDIYDRARRVEPMGLTAEMQWGLLPPPSAAAQGISVAGRLEPAYEVGGDAFDYAIGAGHLDFAVFDPLGADLRAALLAALAVGVYRNCRRSGIPLAEMGERIDAAIVDQFPESQFVTGQLCRLDLDTGVVTWTNAGHPPPLLLRDGQAHPVELGPDRPWGLRYRGSTVGEVALQPGDRMLLYTDGMIEARPDGGEVFGIDRLADLLTRDAQVAAPATELARRLIQEVQQHRGGPLLDDATVVLIEWWGRG